MTRLDRNDLSAFKLRRGNGNGNGLGIDVHPDIKDHLKELNELLGKRVFPDASFAAPSATALAAAAAIVAAGGGGGRGRRKNRNVGGGPDAELSAAGKKVKTFLELPLTAKFAPAKGKKSWDDGTAASYLSNGKEKDANFTLAEYIDKTPALVQLKYEFLDEIQKDWGHVGSGGRLVLGKDYPNLRDYLIAYAYVVGGLRDDDAVKNFILTSKHGVSSVLGYATVSATRAYIEEEQLRVKDYNDDDSDFVKKLQQAQVPLAQGVFPRSTQALIDEFRFDSDEEEIIAEEVKKGTIGDVDRSVWPTLIRYMQASPVTITKKNAENYLPHFVLQILAMKGMPAVDGTDVSSTDADFSVRFQDDVGGAESEVSRPAIEAAAQIFHAMVLGDELDVFGAVGYLTNRRLVMHGGMKIKSPALRRDLQDYVFDNEFVDTKTNERMTRTRPAERQMFYRQVFDYGQGPVPEDMPVNFEFPQLWNVLMLETARYLDRAQASLHPDSFVSPQGVAQAVEDLQYNLSTHCTGMATVLGPIVDAELAFVLDRILRQKQVIEQVVPEGGSWKRAVDKLNMERRARRANATTLYNKANQGRQIIEAIARYTGGDFDDFAKLSAFIGKVDAFITTSSILQKERKRAMKKVELTDEEEHDEGMDEGMPEEERMERMAQPAVPEKVAAGTDEWDF
jgi:hypothetical protein